MKLLDEMNSSEFKDWLKEQKRKHLELKNIYEESMKDFSFLSTWSQKGQEKYIKEFWVDFDRETELLTECIDGDKNCDTYHQSHNVIERMKLRKEIEIILEEMTSSQKCKNPLVVKELWEYMGDDRFGIHDIRVQLIKYKRMFGEKKAIGMGRYPKGGMYRIYEGQEELLINE